MMNQFSYRFTPYRSKGDASRVAAAAQARTANDMMVDKLKADFDLNEASDMGDLRDAVKRLTDV